MSPRQQRRREQRDTVYIPTPLRWQRAVIEHDARYKVARCGRRAGKSRMGLSMCVKGHGPKGHWDGPDRPARRRWKGLAHGTQEMPVKLAWVSPDYGQSKAIWDEEVLPRFSGVAGVTIDQGDRVLHFLWGSLEFVTAENIDSRRGRKYDGVVLDEGAFFDLEYAWNRVIRPTLIDRRGWALFASTTNVGSFFNWLVKEVDEKKRGPRWKSWRFRTRDNERLSEEEFEEVALEYPAGSKDAAQELEAELVEDLGLLFLAEYFHTYDAADKLGMVVGGVWMPFVETRMYVDLASSMKQQADYVAVMVVGLTPKFDRVRKRAGILHVEMQHLEGPAQIALFARMIDEWHPHVTKIEATAYQLTAVQHTRAAKPRAIIEAVYVDKDKRSRAVPWAAAMSRGDVFWPPDVQAPWMRAVRAQHLKFPNGAEDSQHIEDHDDSVDTGSMLAEDQLIVRPRRRMLAPSVSYSSTTA